MEALLKPLVQVWPVLGLLAAWFGWAVYQQRHAWKRDNEYRASEDRASWLKGQAEALAANKANTAALIKLGESVERLATALESKTS